MSVWINQRSENIQDFSAYLTSLRERIGMNWKDSYVQPAKQFFNVAVSEYQSINEETEQIGNLDTSSYSIFFTQVKQKLLDVWNENIVGKIQEEAKD